MPEGKRPAEDLYSAKTHLHQPVPEVSTVNATALPADAPEGTLPSEVRPEIVTWDEALRGHQGQRQGLQHGDDHQGL